jgi:abhydrolase domain-containing protein 5
MVNTYIFGNHVRHSVSDYKRQGFFHSGDNLIWTVRSLQPSLTTVPIVLIHDFGCASGIWIRNIDFLSQHHPLYLFDVLGFGRSSRPEFDPNNTINAEAKFVESIEDWRIAVDLQTKFILVGHGFGAYLATLYASRYGHLIKKLILLDPWGFNPRPDETPLHLQTPFWIKMLAYLTQNWTSFSALRYCGPLGKRWQTKVRLDPLVSSGIGLPLLKFFVPRWKRLMPSGTCDQQASALYEYLYHVNVQPARYT